MDTSQDHPRPTPILTPIRDPPDNTSNGCHELASTSNFQVDPSRVLFLVPASISNVYEQQAMYLSRLIEHTQWARQFQNLLGHHPVRKLSEIVDRNLIQNCPITREDIKITEDVYGPNLGALKSKTLQGDPIEADTTVTGVLYANIVLLLLNTSHHKT
jgi:hypothetical protein